MFTMTPPEMSSQQTMEHSEKQLAREVGILIASRRKAKGMTQAELAKKMGIEKETMSRLETGAISPTLGRLAQLSNLLDCEMADLLQIKPPELMDQAVALMQKLDRLNDSQRDVLLNLFEKIAMSLSKLDEKDRSVVEKFLKDVL